MELERCRSPTKDSTLRGCGRRLLRDCDRLVTAVGQKPHKRLEPVAGLFPLYPPIASKHWHRSETTRCASTGLVQCSKKGRPHSINAHPIGNISTILRVIGLTISTSSLNFT